MVDLSCDAATTATVPADDSFYASRIEFPDGTLEAAVLRDELVARAHTAVRQGLDANLPPRWRRATQTSFATVELTPLQLEELGERFEALLDEYRKAPTKRGSRSIVVSFQAVPRA